MQKLERYLEVALQTDKANLSDVISVLNSKSPTVMDVIVKGERDKIARDQLVQHKHNKNMRPNYNRKCLRINSIVEGVC